MHLPTPLFLFDPDRLDRLSRELADAAGELAGLRSALRSRAGGLAWHSPGARAFAAVLHELLGQLGQSAVRLVELADAVRAHHHRASSRATTLARAAHRGVEAVERAVRLP